MDDPRGNPLSPEEFAALQKQRLQERAKLHDTAAGRLIELYGRAMGFEAVVVIGVDELGLVYQTSASGPVITPSAQEVFDAMDAGTKRMIVEHFNKDEQGLTFQVKPGESEAHAVTRESLLNGDQQGGKSNGQA